MLLDRRSRSRTPLDPEMDLMYGLVPPKLYARFGSMLQMEGVAGGLKDNSQQSYARASLVRLANARTGSQQSGGIV